MVRDRSTPIENVANCVEQELLQGKPNAGGPRIGEYRGVQETQKSSGESPKIKWRGQVRTVLKFGQIT